MKKISLSPFPLIIILFCSLLFNSCDDLSWSEDIESFVENGLSIISLREVVDQDTSSTFSYIPSTSAVELQLNLINPKSLTATYTIESTDTSLLEYGVFGMSDMDALENKIYLTFTPSSDAEHETIEFTLDIEVPSLNKTFDTIDISIACDTPPNELVSLEVGSTTDTLLAVAALTLPSEVTDDDLDTIKITYNLVGDSDKTTVLLDVDDDSYKTYDGTTNLTAVAGDYVRFFSPPGASSNVDYEFSILLIDSVEQTSDATTGSSSINGTFTVDYDLDGGSWVNEPTTSFAYGATVTLPVEDDFSLTDYACSGWIDSDGNEYALGESLTIYSDLTLTPIWGHYVCYYYGTTLTEEVFYDDDDITLDPSSVSTGGVGTFAGWDTSSDSETVIYYDATYGTNALEVTLTEETTDLYEVWVEGIPIRTVEEFESIGVDSSFSLSETYDLMRDLDFSGVTHTPIGDSTEAFSGDFYGNDKIISNLTLTVSSIYSGLFGNVSGMIYDLILTDAAITNTSYTNVGILAGYLSGEVNGCDISGTVDSSGYYIGGLAGSFIGGVITDCSVTVDFTGSAYSLGGYAGYAEGTGSISDSSYEGSISGDYNVGGIFGVANASSTNYLTISDCYVSGDMSGESGKIGGMIGTGYYVTISDSDSSTGSEYSVDNLNIVMTSSGSYVGGVFGLSASVDLTDIAVSNITIEGADQYTGGVLGDSTDATLESCSASDITISNPGAYSGGLIGSAETVNVENCTTSEIEISSIGSNVGGLMGYVNESTILSCSSDSVTLSSGLNSLGGFIGEAYECATITTCSASEVSISGSGYDVGGMFGVVTDTNIEYCTLYLTGIISGSGGTVGGFMGHYKSSTLALSVSESCVYGLGTVDSSDTNIGGFIGKVTTNSNIVIDECYANVNLSGSESDDIGGIVGAHESTDGTLIISNSYYRGDMPSSSWGAVGSGIQADVSLDLTNCYVIATDDSDYLGLAEGSTDESSATDCYYLSYSLIGDFGTRLTVTEMLLSTSFSSWDTLVWGWDSSYNDGYPYLLNLVATY